MNNFLLHTCCAPCASYIIEELKNRDFNIAVFYYNPNIFPKKEYKIRKNEIEKFCKINKIKFFEEKENHKNWLEKTLGLKKEPEGGLRCEKCYQIRLEKTAEFAQQNGYKYFDSTLSISPHKNYEKIKLIGDKFAKKFNLNFYGQNWKKQDGFKKSCEISHQHNFYRQNYCGCEFSLSSSAQTTL